jgi:hypothetical protein
VNNIKHFANQRCPITNLTKLQIYALASFRIGMPLERTVPYGVYRSLVIRGLLTSAHRLTADGYDAWPNAKRFKRSSCPKPATRNSAG